MSADLLNITRAESYNYWDIPQHFEDFTFEGRIFDLAIGYDY